MSAVSTLPATIEVAVTASIRAHAEAVDALHRARAERSRAATALERTARRRDCDEAERERLRAAYAAADRRVAERETELEQARDLRRAWAVVAPTLDLVPAAPAAPAADAPATARTARRRAPRRPARRPVARPA
ncbi:hypothetical protein [Microbacterium sp.]|uniref:hypothetical protein n=1 Tax=Microbacterium sp. TaxID=51671 RepID=UPI0037CC6FC9